MELPCSSPSMPKKKASPKNSTPAPSKTAFVLGLPHDMPASEVVSKGQEAGISLTDQYVYTIRSLHRAKSGEPSVRAPRGAKRGRKPASSVEAAPKAAKGSATVEAQFVELALDVGLARAESLLSRLRSKAKAIVL